MRPSNPAPSEKHADENSYSRTRRPRASVFPDPDSDKAHERNPLPAQDVNGVGAGVGNARDVTDGGGGTAPAVLRLVDGSRLYTEKSRVDWLGTHSGLPSQLELVAAPYLA